PPRCQASASRLRLAPARAACSCALPRDPGGGGERRVAHDVVVRLRLDVACDAFALRGPHGLVMGGEDRNEGVAQFVRVEPPGRVLVVGAVEVVDDGLRQRNVHRGLLAHRPASFSRYGFLSKQSERRSVPVQSCPASMPALHALAALSGPTAPNTARATRSSLSSTFLLPPVP